MLEKTIKIGREKVKVDWTIPDRIANYFNPVNGQKRLRARAMSALTGGYLGGTGKQRALKNWRAGAGSPDSDINYDLPKLRGYSRDLARKCPLATGAIATVNTAVVGTGLKLQSRLDRDVLSISDDEASALESRIEREFALFAADCDIRRTLNFREMQALVLRSTLESGDNFVLMPRKKRKGTLNPYTLKLQTVEADRVCNEGNKPDTSTLVQGVGKDKDGAPVEYHIAHHHPGDYRTAKSREWTKVKAFTPSGRRNVIHLYPMLRPDQTRGVPYLAPVIEQLRQVSEYTDAELYAAVINGLNTIYITSPEAEFEMPGAGDSETVTSGSTTIEEQNLGRGAMIDLAPGEKPETVSPERPNSAFDPFFKAIVRQIGVALELPFEILIKHFTASYSAARAALLEAWKFFSTRRQWLVTNFCHPVFEAWFDEAVAMGRIPAPGYFTDPIIRQAYLKSVWIGPAKGMIDEVKEVAAAEKKIALGISTRAQETAALTGEDFETVHRQLVKEHKLRVGDGLEEPVAAALPTSTPPADDNNDDTGDLEQGDLETGDTEKPDNEMSASDKKIVVDTAGIGVKGGVLTPQQEDEVYLRGLIGLPPLTKPVADAWETDGGTRRPITLTSQEAFEAEGKQAEAAAGKSDPEPEDKDDGGDDETT